MYNLRPRNRSLTITQMKNILSRGKTDETVSKNAEKQTKKTNITDTQPTKTKSAETPMVKKQKEKSPAIETKPSPQNKVDKGIEAQTIENDKIVGNFNLENEINKIKIPIPLVKLAKNPIYRKQIAKMISFSEDESQADAINLEDGKPNIVFGPLFKGTKDTASPLYIMYHVNLV
jgi:hypothetical protein